MAAAGRAARPRGASTAAYGPQRSLLAVTARAMIMLTATAVLLSSYTVAPSTPRLLIWEGTSTDMGVMTAIGLLNRPSAADPSPSKPFFSAAYASFGWSNHHSREWLEEALATDPKLAGAQMMNTTNSTQVIQHAMASGAARGVVLFNSSEGSGLLPTVLTLCSVYDAVAIDCHKLPGTAGCHSGGDYAAAAADWPVIFDARGRWQDSLSAGTWAADHLLLNTASDDTMVVVDPGVVSSGYLVDVAISRKLFVMANKVCTPFSGASKLFDRVAESEHWQRQHLLSIMGCECAPARCLSFRLTTPWLTTRHCRAQTTARRRF
jgi:hypothetical protein